MCMLWFIFSKAILLSHDVASVVALTFLCRDFYSELNIIFFP